MHPIRSATHNFNDDIDKKKKKKARNIITNETKCKNKIYTTFVSDVVFFITRNCNFTKLLRGFIAQAEE